MRRYLLKNTRVAAIGAAGALLLAMSACAYQPRPSMYSPAAFWVGLVQGFIILFSFIGSLFSDVRIYQFPNAGVWYDGGFVLGAALFFGAVGRGRR